MVRGGDPRTSWESTLEKSMSGVRKASKARSRGEDLNCPLVRGTWWEILHFGGASVEGRNNSRIHWGGEVDLGR
jgi:hypothetical protein